jgi:hypothetical protein
LLQRLLFSVLVLQKHSIAIRAAVMEVVVVQVEDGLHL